jgi:hypothetical protein
VSYSSYNTHPIVPYFFLLTLPFCSTNTKVSALIRNGTRILASASVWVARLWVWNKSHVTPVCSSYQVVENTYIGEPVHRPLASGPLTMSMVSENFLARQPQPAPPSSQQMSRYRRPSTTVIGHWARWSAHVPRGDSIGCSNPIPGTSGAGTTPVFT